MRRLRRLGLGLCAAASTGRRPSSATVTGFGFGFGAGGGGEPPTLPFVFRPRPAPSSSSSSSSLSASSRDPHDGETPEERRARMELVRRIQANFYRPLEGADAAPSSTTDDDDAIVGDGAGGRRWLARDPRDASLLLDLPLWRVQWTEFPGYQNVLNVHVAHYTHMFRKLMSHPRPWYFGHVHLPGGSENLANPDYFLPAEGDGDPGGGDPAGRVPRVGTLMRIADCLEREDGRLALVVQAVDRIEILAASQHVPYAVASRARILPDAECMERLRLDVAAGTTTATTTADVELSAAYEDAARAAAARESELLRDLEYRGTTMEPHATADGAAMVSGVSPLSNVNVSASVDFDALEAEVRGAFSRRLARRAEECGGDDLLLAGATFRWSDVASSSEEDVVALERDVWIKLDEMIRLLGRAQPGARIPVPAQLLGLLPTDADWPDAFRLEGYAAALGENGAAIGTFSKSPFVRLGDACPDYPPMRRASRLSYTVWLLIESVSAIGGGFDKERYLNTLGVGDRLKTTLQYLELINKAIEDLIG